MNINSIGNLRGRRCLEYIALAVLFLALLAGVTREFGSDDSSTGNSGPSYHLADSDAGFRANSVYGKKRMSREMLVSRTAKGSAYDLERYSAWKLLQVGNLIGKPQVGDIAYLARLGPDRGLMKVEGIDGGTALLSLGTLDKDLIREGDRIETMPPNDYNEKRSPTTPRAEQEDSSAP